MHVNIAAYQKKRKKNGLKRGQSDEKSIRKLNYERSENIFNRSIRREIKMSCKE